MSKGYLRMGQYWRDLECWSVCLFYRSDNAGLTSIIVNHNTSDSVVVVEWGIQWIEGQTDQCA